MRRMSLTSHLCKSAILIMLISCNGNVHELQNDFWGEKNTSEELTDSSIIRTESYSPMDISDKEPFQMEFWDNFISSDTCYKIYRVSNFDIYDSARWYRIKENLYNVVIRYVSQSEYDSVYPKGKEYLSPCDVAVVYCVDVDSNECSSMCLGELTDKIICSYRQDNDAFSIDPNNTGKYK